MNSILRKAIKKQKTRTFNMITEDYVSFEVAKLLKEKGFDVYVHSFYDADDMPAQHNEALWDWNLNKENYRFSAPTLQMAMKWLRETHNIGIFPSLFAFCVGEGGAAKPTYGTKIISLKSCELLTNDTNPMPTYEEACAAAIKYCLENLI